MIHRDAESLVLRRAQSLPVVTITGPRQAGKTTLCRRVFSDKPYVSLEAPDERARAQADPREFLRSFPEGAVLDEVQRVPELLSYLQGIVDEHNRPGEWVLTGSSNFALLASVSQSLAGRTALVNLLPLSWAEIERFDRQPADLTQAMVTGGFPRIHEQRLTPNEWISDYVSTYLERDVRQLIQVADLARFQDFIRHCAARSGQLLNLSALGADCGISHHTAKSWLGVLEASFLVFQLPPVHRNLRKRLTRTRKLYFGDTGLLCWLLGIERPDQLTRHPLRGAIFETWVVSEIVKARTHAGLTTNGAGGLRFYRDQAGLEVDVVLENPGKILAVECKAGTTIASDALNGLRRFSELINKRDPEHPEVSSRLVYGGDEGYVREGVELIPWRSLGQSDWGG